MVDGLGPPVASTVAQGALSALLMDIARQVGSGPEEAAPRLRPGAAVGRFEIVRELGRGGFGFVYEAMDRELGRTVALKLLGPGDGRDLPDERLLKEAETAARLSHPNIVALFDVGRCEHGPYLVMEMLCGQTLAERLGQGKLPLLEALRIGVEVAKGLAHAHSRGVVHRDLTPGNVFLCEDGQVKLLDLGMAHAFGWRKVAGGTPAYMAPEQAKGAPEDERTDVFALGAVLYEMLAGDRPFDDRRALESARPAPVLEVPAEPALGQLVARMLEKDPVKRPRDAGRVLAALSAFAREVERGPVAGKAEVRRRSWPSAALPRLAKARRLAVLVALGVLLAAALGAAAIGWYTRAGPRARTAPLAPPPAEAGSLVMRAAGRGGVPHAPGGTPYGQSYEQWAVAWWKWAIGAPATLNPILDPTGKSCSVGQHGVVWFLGGAPKPIERHCTLPAGRALFFPVVNYLHCREPDDPPLTRAELETTVAPVEQATRLEVLVNGYPVTGLSRYLVTSPEFSVALPPGNIFGHRAGTVVSPCLGKGYYVMLTPLAPGRHALVIRGETPLIAQDVTYHLEVEAER